MALREHADASYQRRADGGGRAGGGDDEDEGGYDNDYDDSATAVGGSSVGGDLSMEAPSRSGAGLTARRGGGGGGAPGATPTSAFGGDRDDENADAEDESLRARADVAEARAADMAQEISRLRAAHVGELARVHSAHSSGGAAADLTDEQVRVPTPPWRRGGTRSRRQLGRTQRANA